MIILLVMTILVLLSLIGFLFVLLTYVTVQSRRKTKELEKFKTKVIVPKVVNYGEPIESEEDLIVVSEDKKERKPIIIGSEP